MNADKSTMMEFINKLMIDNPIPLDGSATTGASPDFAAAKASMRSVIDAMDRFAEAARDSAKAFEAFGVANRPRMPPMISLVRPPDGTLFGLPVFISRNAVTSVPNRKHCWRRNQKRAYHLRIEKKWAKRWGTRLLPAAFMINPGAAGLYGAGPAQLIIHDEIHDKLKGGS